MSQPQYCHTGSCCGSLVSTPSLYADFVNLAIGKKTLVDTIQPIASVFITVFMIPKNVYYMAGVHHLQTLTAYKILITILITILIILIANIVHTILDGGKRTTLVALS